MMQDQHRKEETEVLHGFVIFDRHGKVWLDQVFADEDGANMTAARCCPADVTIRAAREIKWLDYRPGTKLPVLRRQIILDE